MFSFFFRKGEGKTIHTCFTKSCFIRKFYTNKRKSINNNKVMSTLYSLHIRVPVNDLRNSFSPPRLKKRASPTTHPSTPPPNFSPNTPSNAGQDCLAFEIHNKTNSTNCSTTTPSSECLNPGSPTTLTTPTLPQRSTILRIFHCPGQNLCASPK